MGWIVDIHAKIDEQIDIDVEIQIVNQNNIEKRILFYWSKLYTKGIKSGDDYSKLPKIIAILIVDFKLEKLKEIPKIRIKWQIREEKYQSVILTDVLELYISKLFAQCYIYKIYSSVLFLCIYINLLHIVGAQTRTLLF